MSNTASNQSLDYTNHIKYLAKSKSPKPAFKHDLRLLRWAHAVLTWNVEVPLDPSAFPPCGSPFVWPLSWKPPPVGMGCIFGRHKRRKWSTRTNHHVIMMSLEHNMTSLLKQTSSPCFLQTKTGNSLNSSTYLMYCAGACLSAALTGMAAAIFWDTCLFRAARVFSVSYRGHTFSTPIITSDTQRG